MPNVKKLHRSPGSKLDAIVSVQTLGEELRLPFNDRFQLFEAMMTNYLLKTRDCQFMNHLSVCMFIRLSIATLVPRTLISDLCLAALTAGCVASVAAQPAGHISRQ
jgi:hypothetical protein